MQSAVRIEVSRLAPVQVAGEIRAKVRSRPVNVHAHDLAGLVTFTTSAAAALDRPELVMIRDKTDIANLHVHGWKLSRRRRLLGGVVGQDSVACDVPTPPAVT